MIDLVKNPVDLDESAATTIAAGMRAVARADGSHPREEALIDELEKELGAATGDHPVDLATLDTPGKQEVFLKSLVLVAFADGQIGRAEGEMIRRYADDLGLGDAEVARCISDVAQVMLSQLAGVKVYREQVVALGRSMGLDLFTIEGILSEA